MRIAMIVPLAVLLGGLAGCASGPIETDLPPSTPTPAEVLERGEAGDAGEAPAAAVLWGGLLTGGANLDGTTQFEVLAYPLDRRQRPLTGRTPQGRFLIVADGYLETLDYADGRLVTVLGTLEETREATVGEARVRLPVVRAESLHLWRDGDGGTSGGPRFSFGLGLSL